MSMDHTNGSCHSCAMDTADQYAKSNTTRSGVLPWQRPRRVPLAMHIPSLEVALEFDRVNAEYCVSDR